MQWHPLFAKMLRLLVQEYYDVQTGLPVGDAPRVADIVLLRLTSTQPPAFHGLLQYLTIWNVWEFKGRSVTARLHDLDLLVEVGLGIDRRLNEEQTRQRQPVVAAPDVSFWYIANHLGRRFLRDAQDILGRIMRLSPGVWRSQILRHPLFLVDGRTVPVERESVPLHLVGEESPVIEPALARVIVDEPGFWELYGSILGVLHPSIWKEAKRMATAKRKTRGLDFRPFVEQVGLEKFLESFEIGTLIDMVGPKKIVKALGVKQFLANLSTEEKQQLKELLK